MGAHKLADAGGIVDRGREIPSLDEQWGDWVREPGVVVTATEADAGFGGGPGVDGEDHRVRSAAGGHASRGLASRGEVDVLAAHRP